ncbi:MAG: hypothetical protein FD155_2111 [Bacteroidetes bacterium]|nr:MAG: hypothetical protein FD155_2111 [Bacteroidota bacterium]
MSLKSKSIHHANNQLFSISFKILKRSLLNKDFRLHPANSQRKCMKTKQIVNTVVMRKGQRHQFSSSSKVFMS